MLVTCPCVYVNQVFSLTNLQLSFHVTNSFVSLLYLLVGTSLLPIIMISNRSKCYSRSYQLYISSFSHCQFMGTLPRFMLHVAFTLAFDIIFYYVIVTTFFLNYYYFLHVYIATVISSAKDNEDRRKNDWRFRDFTSKVAFELITSCMYIIETRSL